MRTFKILALAALLAGSAPLSAAPIPTAPIHTNKNRFRIPFHYDSAELARLGAREIRLYVSRDRGATWKQVQAVAPDAGKFHFQSAGDGEYWFIVRTLDSKNHLHPEGNVADPGLKVIVDTVPPRLELDLSQPTPGKVQLAWTAADEHLDPTQLRLEYLQPGVLEWQSVGIVPKASGQTGWAVPQGGIVAVRGSIADLAGNSINDQAQLRIAPGNQAVPRPGTPDRREPVAGPTTRPRDDLALTLPDRFPSGRNRDDAAVASQHPTDNADPDLAQSAHEPPAIAIAPKNSFVSLKPADQPSADPRQDPAASTPGGARSARVGGRQRVVGSRKFQIGYKLQDVGPSGVASVELYISQDDGQTWFRYGTDDDNHSPFPVEVPHEGTYGFTLGVRSASGAASEPPQNGDPPAIVVVVDQTPPALELLPIEQGFGKNHSKLFVAWKCTDENLSERPILLYYALGPQGPWQPIAGPIENSGNFAWTISEGAASRFYLRIEARDLAGNVQTVDSPKPIVIDTSRPTAQIIDIESPEAPASPRE